MENHIIEIDAHAAYLKIGVDLRISPFADLCVQSLRQRLMECLDTELIIAALTDATKARRSRRARKSSGGSGEPAKVNRSHES